MKMKKLSVLLLIVVLFCTMTGFFANWKAENNIKKGDAEAEKGNYKKAFEYYKAAEEKGYMPAKNLHRQRAEKQLEEKKYDDALDYLLKDAKDYFSEQEALDIVMETVTGNFKSIQADAMKEIERAKASSEPISTHYAAGITNSLIQFMEEEIVPNHPYDKTFLNDLYTLAGLSRLYNAHPLYKDTDWSGVMVNWRKCDSGIGYEVTQLEKHLKEAKFIEAQNAISKIDLPLNAITNLLQDKVTQSKYSFDQVEYTSLEEIMAHIKLLYKTRKSPVTAETLKEALQNVDELEVGVDYIHYGIELNETMIQKLKETCGKSPRGKVLFLHVRTPYHTYINLMNQYMMELPEKYYPESLEEVEYVFVIEGTSRLTGRTYTMGTKQIQEKAVVTVYDMKTGKSVYTGQKFGPVENTMYYSGKVPSTYSAGAPDILELLQKACDKIGY